MRILLITDSDVFAGTERHMFDLALELEQLGNSIAVACPGSGALAERVRARGLAVFPIERGPGKGWKSVWRLVDALRANAVDVIHAHNGRTSLWAALALFLCGRRGLVVTQHFLAPARTARSRCSRWLSTHLHRWIGSQCVRVVAISEAVRQSVLARHEVDAEKVITILNGIGHFEAKSNSTDTKDLLGVPLKSPMIACCARLEKEKQVDVLISAMKMVVEKVPNARCVIAGEGKLKAPLLQQIAALGLGEAVSLLGFRQDAIAIIAAADLFVLPSLAEPFGLSLIEAMALGKPVIATRAGGPMEIVIHEGTGLLVPPSDATALANAIVQVLHDPVAASKMGSEGKARFEKVFTAARMAEEMLSVYQTAGVCTGRSAPRRPHAAEPASADIHS